MNTEVQAPLQHTLSFSLDIYSIMGLLEHVGGFDFQFGGNSVLCSIIVLAYALLCAGKAFSPYSCQCSAFVL